MEPALIILALGIGLACPVWYLRARRRGWLVTLVSAVLLVFSFTSALLHGWIAAEYVFVVLLILASVGVVLATIVANVLLHRRISHLNRALEDEVREAGNEVLGEAPLRREGLFRDDGQRLLVYPSRRQLLGFCVGQALLGGGCTAIYLFVPIDNLLLKVALLLALILFMAILTAIFAATLSRLLYRRPTIVIGPDGIRDDGSLLATGMGLLRWNEILGVLTSARREGWATRTHLNILVSDAEAIRQRQPLWKRFALVIITQQPASISIAPSLLDRPPDEIAREIEQYARTHAPSDWPVWIETESSASL